MISIVIVIILVAFFISEIVASYVITTNQELRDFVDDWIADPSNHSCGVQVNSRAPTKKIITHLTRASNFR